jgi:hypothetical protein
MKTQATQQLIRHHYSKLRQRLTNCKKTGRSVQGDRNMTRGLAAVCCDEISQSLTI